MEGSNINLDIYPLIGEYLNWSTLQNFKLVNNFCYNIYKKEHPIRLNSHYPFGEKESKIKIVVNDIFLEKIYCVIDEIIIEIPLEKIYISYVSEVLNQWFHYSFRNYKWILTGKIIKSILRINNKLLESERKKISEDIQSLTFHFKNGKSSLYLIE